MSVEMALPTGDHDGGSRRGGDGDDLLDPEDLEHVPTLSGVLGAEEGLGV
jgi:hypothetical protein